MIQGVKMPVYNEQAIQSQNSGLLQGFDCAVWKQGNNGDSLNDDFRTLGDLKGQEVFGNFGDFPDNTTGSQHFIANGQGVKHFPLFFLFFLLWTDHQKIKHDKHERDRKKTSHAVQAETGCSGLGVCVGNEHDNSSMDFCLTQDSSTMCCVFMHLCGLQENIALFWPNPFEIESRMMPFQ